jgi:hypothetical protein
MFDLCPPSIINIIFSLTHIIIDIFNGLYNSAFLKFLIMLLITLLLQILCNTGLAIISWFIVFIPFIFMTVIVTMLLYIFGLNAATGKLNYETQPSNSSPHHPPPPPLNPSRRNNQYFISSSPEYKS